MIIPSLSEHQRTHRKRLRTQLCHWFRFTYDGRVDPALLYEKAIEIESGLRMLDFHFSERDDPESDTLHDALEYAHGLHDRETRERLRSNLGPLKRYVQALGQITR